MSNNIHRLLCPATAEAARRYYSVKQFDRLGAPNVAFGIVPWSIFGKFFDLSHALASGTFRDFFDYPKFKVHNPEMGVKNEEHIFWDGGFRSNTPLMEVIQAHGDYWHKTRKHK